MTGLNSKRWGPRIRTEQDFYLNFAARMYESRLLEQQLLNSNSTQKNSLNDQVSQPQENVQSIDQSRFNFSTVGASNDQVSQPQENVQSIDQLRFNFSAVGASSSPLERSDEDSIVDSNARLKFKAEHFDVIYSPFEKVKEWYKKFPAISRRNFYVLHRHNATSPHFDIRIQLDNETISFALPKGLSDFPIFEEDIEGKRGIRQAIETNPHGIGYTLFEGGGTGTTAVWDLGNYKIGKTIGQIRYQKKQAEKLLKKGYTGDDTTEDEDDDSEEEDVKQEKLFYEAYNRASRRGMKSSEEDLILQLPDGAKEAGNEARGFVIELNGTRFKGLKLLFSHRQGDTKASRPRGTPKDEHLMVSNRIWIVTLQDKRDIKCRGIEDKSIGEVSILTGRTMEEIKNSRTQERAYLDEKLRENKFYLNKFFEREVGYEDTEEGNELYTLTKDIKDNDVQDVEMGFTEEDVIGIALQKDLWDHYEKERLKVGEKAEVNVTAVELDEEGWEVNSLVYY